MSEVMTIQQNYEFHSASMIFPMMEQEPLEKLAEDIKKNGLIEPIILYENLVLDGRNRLAACIMAEVEPRFEHVTGAADFPFIYALSKNLHRRHLTTSQRAAIAAEALPHLMAESEKRSMANLCHQQDISTTQNRVIEGVQSAAVVAKAARVGRGTVEAAWAVKKRDPELFEKIKAGEITAHTAERALNDKELREEIRQGGNGKRKQTRPDKSAPFEINSDHTRNMAESQKNRLDVSVGSLMGIAEGLATLDVGKIRAASSAKELNRFQHSIRESCSTIRAFARLLTQEDQ